MVNNEGLKMLNSPIFFNELKKKKNSEWSDFFDTFLTFNE